METITIVDTAIGGDNIGDAVIMDSVDRIVSELFPHAYIFKIPSHELPSDRGRSFLRRSEWAFVGGSNLLSSHMHRYGLWRLSKKDARLFGEIRTTLIGAGWSDYLRPPTARTKSIFQLAFRPEMTQSVRDTYTYNHLTSAGIRAEMTACASMWRLTPEHCAKIPKTRSKSAVITLSAWREAVAADRAFVEALRRHYKEIFFFCQSQEDDKYFRSFGWDDIKLVPPTLKGYDKVLTDNEVDYIGTRLHGGIRALQKGRRALILATDNRATEISKDTGLPVVQRDEIQKIEDWIESETPTTVNLPEQAIAAWRGQFSPEQRNKIPFVKPSASIWDEGRPAWFRKKLRTASGLLLDAFS